MSNRQTEQITEIENKYLSQLPESKADQIKEVFGSMIVTIKQYENEFSELIELHKADKENKEIHEQAGELRKQIKATRVATEKERKAQKSFYLTAGKAIDGIANILKFAVSDMEESLSDIEKYFEIQETNRINELFIARSKLVEPYLIDEPCRSDLGLMDDELFDLYLNTKKTEFENILEARKIREKQEQEQKEREQKEREKQIAENKRLQEENKKLQDEKLKRIAEDKKRKEEEENRSSGSDMPKLKQLKTDLETILEYKFKSKYGKAVMSDVEEALFPIINDLYNYIPNKEEK